MNLFILRLAAALIKSQSLFIIILIIDISLLQVIVWKLLDSFTQLDVCLNEQMKIMIKIQSYIAEVKNHIIILKRKLSIIENYVVRT